MRKTRTVGKTRRDSQNKANYGCNSNALKIEATQLKRTEEGKVAKRRLGDLITQDSEEDEGKGGGMG